MDIQTPNSPPGIASAATADTGAFASATSHPETIQPPGPERPGSRVNTQLKVFLGPDQIAYLADPNISESAARLWAPQARGNSTDVEGTPSTTSSLGDDLPLSGEALVSALATDLSSVPLTPHQLNKLSNLRNMFSMSREALLSTTGLVTGQRSEIVGLAGHVTTLRDEVSLRIDELSDAVVGASFRLESTLENNLRVLRATGATEVELKALAETVHQHCAQPIAPARMPLEVMGGLASPTNLGNAASAINTAMPPMQLHESIDDFHRRGTNAVTRKLKAAASFDGHGGSAQRYGAPPTVAPNPDSMSDTGHSGRETLRAPPVKSTRFLSTESALMMGTRAGYYGPLKVAPMGLNQSASGYLTPLNNVIGPATSHARVWIEGLGAMRGLRTTTNAPSGGTNTLRAPAPAPAPARAPVRGVQTRAATRAVAANTIPAANSTRTGFPTAPRTHTTPTAHATSNAPTMRFNPNAGMPNKSNKTCFNCGKIGHIASDPNCPRFNESASARPRPAAQFHAQRVDASHSVEDHDELDDVDNNDARIEDEDLAGTWGDYPGDQGDDGVDEHEAPDLQELLGDRDEPEVRVGAMWQYYAMRIAPSLIAEDEIVPNSPAPAVRSRTLVLDTDVTLVSVTDDVYAAWTAENKAATEARYGIGWDTGIVSPDTLFAALEEHYGSRVHNAQSTAEITAIEALSAEDHARTSWEGLLGLQPVMVRRFSAEYMRSTTIDVDTEITHLETLLRGLQQTLINLHGLIDRRVAAKHRIRAMNAAPSGSVSRAPCILGRAAIANRRLLDDMRMGAHLLELRLTRMTTSLRDLQNEATWRAMERESYHLARATARPTPPGSPATVDPPQYPGSPRESDRYYSAEDLPDLSRVPGLESDSSGEASLLATESSLSFTASVRDGDPGSEGGAEYDTGSDNGEGPVPADEVILRSVEVITSEVAERITTLVTANGDLSTYGSHKTPSS
ncbi:hypothetical protein K438DRAFT_1760025 [Mycena galopus ATCC 62051]|nr:hypothetical protein K438DRAFT_1760025 [Mycena galopus ATCC 62051]